MRIQTVHQSLLAIRSRLASDLFKSLSALPTSGYVFFIILAIGSCLLLSRDFGQSWDISKREYGALEAFNFYFHGFDAAKFRANQISTLIYYGPAIDILIKIAQDTTVDPLQRAEIRTFLQALISLSCLIPIFLISARVVEKPLALISAALVGATPAFFGHAFINPKDSVFASGFLWALYLILVCFGDTRRRSYRFTIGLGILLGLVVSIRFTGAYLLLLIPVVAFVQPSLWLHESKLSISLPKRLLQQAALEWRRLAILILVFVIAYALLMPAILTDFRLAAFAEAIRKFEHFPWPWTVLYFGKEIPASQLPWHYVYGYMLVQLPVYYHFFLLVILTVFIAWPRRVFLQNLRELCCSDLRARTVMLLAAALMIPLIWILLVHPVLYDGFRHILFVVPLISMLLYFGFVAALKGLVAGVRWPLILLATAGWMEALLAMQSLHPYEYVYYNPLVKPMDVFELEYFGTSFRELAGQLNEYARDNIKNGEKIRLYACPSEGTLTPFLEPDRFEIVKKDAAPQLMVLLNRWGCMKPNRLISVTRRNLIFAAIARSERLVDAPQSSIAGPPR